MSSAFVYAVWAVLAVALFGAVLWSRASDVSIARPSAVLERLASGPVLRVVLVVGWMFAGWHLFAR
ncbi:MAG TPA: DUF6186 family protein [Acidimicrobiales bacterium]|nr:DUF6186 family protein [Acidimicrobiales bacterium]